MYRYKVLAFRDSDLVRFLHLVPSSYFWCQTKWRVYPKLMGTVQSDFLLWREFATCFRFSSSLMETVDGTENQPVEASD